MKVVVFGSTGGTGRAVIRVLLAAGHQVTAFARDPANLTAMPRLALMRGDAMDAGDVAYAVAGHDAVVVTLGNSQTSIARAFGARRTTPPDICEAGTRNVIAAMRAAAVRRLVCITAFGIGATRGRVSRIGRLLYRSILREEIADKEKQEMVVRASGLDWTLVQPPRLTSRPVTGRWRVSATGEIGAMEIHRDDVAGCVEQLLIEDSHVGESVTVSV